MGPSFGKIPKMVVLNVFMRWKICLLKGKHQNQTVLTTRNQICKQVIKSVVPILPNFTIFTKFCNTEKQENYVHTYTWQFFEKKILEQQLPWQSANFLYQRSPLFITRGQKFAGFCALQEMNLGILQKREATKQTHSFKL